MANDVVSNLGRWFWYLVPANPILIRVVHGGSRRLRDLLYRFGYLLVLFLVFLFLFLLKADQFEGSLSEVAKISTQIFRGVSYWQLLLMCFLAPVFTAGAITQEKDAETYNILLTTPLSNAQIIFGSLLSRLYFVIVLLISGLPIFFVTMIYGGVTLSQIVLSFTVAASTAVLTGSLAIMVSMMRAGTRRSIFSFYFLIGLYLTSVYFLGQLRYLEVPEAVPPPGGNQAMSWLAPFHPFLALQVGLNELPAPDYSAVAHYGWPTKYLLAYPHVSYGVMTLIAALLMIIFSMCFVRRGAKEGEITWSTRFVERFSRKARETDTRRRKPRRVWSNPVAWREANTRASAGGSSMMRWATIAGGVIASLILLMYLVKAPPVLNEDGSSVPFGPLHARKFLMWLVLVEFIIILLVATNASATSMTKERESNSMDIMLSTPLTSKYIVWGKLRGLMSFTIPMLVVPIISLLVFVIYDVVMIGRSTQAVLNFEAVFELAVLMVVFTALACVIGLQISLKSKKTVRAVLVSVTMMSLICGLLYVVGDAIVKNAGNVGAFFAPGTPFTAVKVLTYPDIYNLGPHDGSTRLLVLIGTGLTFLAYGLVVGAVYKSLIRNFDMTVRKQTAS